MVSIPVFLKSSHVNAHLKSAMYLYAGATMAIFLVRSVCLFTLIVHLDGATRALASPSSMACPQLQISCISVL